MTFRTIFFLGILIAALLVAYLNKRTRVTLCGKTFSVPNSCSAKSPTYLTCSDFELSCLHVDERTHDYIARDLLHKREKEKQYKKEEIHCFIMGTKAMGYKLTSSEKSCMLIIHGKANEQAIIVTAVLPLEPRSTKELPRFVRQIVQLSD